MLSRLWRDEGATHILYPMMALVALTFAVLLLIPYQRFKAGREGRVTAEVILPNRNLINLLEMPVLFYVACLTAYVTHAVSGTLVGLAWAYVALRLAHSAVHLTYNKGVHRLTIYAASNALLVVIWVRLFFSLIRG